MTVLTYKRYLKSKRRRKALSKRNLMSQVKKEMQAHGKVVKRTMEGFTVDWSEKNRPEFIIAIETSTNELKLIVRPKKNRKASQIWEWVDQGTKPYTIKPKSSNKSGLLTFQTGYQPKTAPIVGGGGKAVGGWVRTREVKHPGIKPRGFTQKTLKRTTPEFRARMEKVIQRIVRESERG